MISPAYREQNKRLHETRADYGAGGHKWASTIARLAEVADATSVLDYGAGKQTLKAALPGLAVHSYDPAIAGIDAPPAPHKIVACCDVLEHIEPDCLDAVLDDLARLATKYAFLVIATRPAKKFLEDGRNAHLIQENAAWWLPKLMDRWKLVKIVGDGYEFVFIGGAKP